MKIHLGGLAIRWFLTIVMLPITFFFTGIRFSYAKTPACPFIENKPVKVEAWLSKRYEKNYRSCVKNLVL